MSKTNENSETPFRRFLLDRRTCLSMAIIGILLINASIAFMKLDAMNLDEVKWMTLGGLAANGTIMLVYGSIVGKKSLDDRIFFNATLISAAASIIIFCLRNEQIYRVLF